MYQIDTKFDRQLRPATETSWLVSYGGKTIPRWRTAAILKINISPYLSEKSSDFHKILYTAADFELDKCHVIKNEKSCILQTPSSTERISSEFDRTYFLLLLLLLLLLLADKETEKSAIRDTAATADDSGHRVT